MDQVSLFNLMMSQLAGQGQPGQEQAPPAPPGGDWPGLPAGAPPPPVGLARPRRPVGVAPLAIEARPGQPPLGVGQVPPAPESMQWGGQAPPSAAPQVAAPALPSPPGPQAGVPFDPTMEWLQSLPDKQRLATGSGGFPTANDVNWQQDPAKMARNFQTFYKQQGPYRDPLAPTNGVSRTMEVGPPGTYDLMQYRMREAHQEQAMQDYQKLLAQDTMRTGAQAEGANKLDVERLRQAGAPMAAVMQKLAAEPDMSQTSLNNLINRTASAQAQMRDAKMGAAAGGGGGTLTVAGTVPPLGVGGTGRPTPEDTAAAVKAAPSAKEMADLMKWLEPGGGATNDPRLFATQLLNRLAANQKFVSDRESLDKIAAGLRGGPGGITQTQLEGELQKQFITHARTQYQGKPVSFGGLELSKGPMTRGPLDLGSRVSWNMIGPNGQGTNRSIAFAPLAETMSGQARLIPWNMTQSADKEDVLRASTLGQLILAIQSAQGAPQR